MESKKHISINVIFCLNDDENRTKDLNSNFICCFDQDEWLQDYEDKPVLYGGGAIGETFLSNEEIAKKLEQKLKELMEEIENGV